MYNNVHGKILKNNNVHAKIQQKLLINYKVIKTINKSLLKNK